MRRGHSVAELLVVLIVAAAMLAVVIPRASAMLDRVAVQAAVGDVAATLGGARNLAIAARAGVAIDLDSLSGVLRVRRGSEMLFSRNVGHAHGYGCVPRATPSRSGRGGWAAGPRTSASSSCVAWSRKRCSCRDLGACAEGAPVLACPVSTLYGPGE